MRQHDRKRLEVTCKVCGCRMESTGNGLWHCTKPSDLGHRGLLTDMAIFRLVGFKSGKLPDNSTKLFKVTA